MHKTKIDWADYTWNPVWGCENNCPYCYARRTAERFGFSFHPHWREENFSRSMPKEPSIIFVNSMSEIKFWAHNWVDNVFRRIREHPEHVFLFLTKFPEIYRETKWQDLPDNCWCGVTATSDDDLEDKQVQMYGLERLFLSAEPLHGPMDMVDDHLWDWLIVGAETGNRKGKVIPEREWIEGILRYDELSIFVKHNMPEWVFDEFENLREYPPDILRYLSRPL